ncbi:MAG TPA: hypothetical protein VFX43_10070 [Chitinophagaceae bacterium]|nr:hypothetical protein [Chitinophagaceae bacterium]
MGFQKHAELNDSDVLSKADVTKIVRACRPAAVRIIPEMVVGTAVLSLSKFQSDDFDATNSEPLWKGPVDYSREEIKLLKRS